MKVYNLLIALMLSMSLFSSCACEEDAATDESAVIRLSLGTGATKTNAAIPADNGGTVGANEGKINTVCVGIFDSSDYLLTLHEYTYSGDESILTTTRAKQIVVAANVPTGQFKDVSTRSGFLAKVQSLAYTSSANGLTDANKTNASSQTLTALPMSAQLTLSSTLSSTTTTNQPLTLSRVVSRVVLKSFTVDFGSTVPFAGATFVPKEIFMYNVNDRYQWTGTTSSSATNLSGEITSGVAGSLVASSSSNTAYLSSGLLTMTGAAGTKTYLSTTDNPYFFYVFPHNATTPTKLVIKGIYYPKGGSEATGEVMYYPIIINHSQTGTTITDTDNKQYQDGAAYSKDSQLAANTTYNLSVTIQGRGVTDVTQDITPSSATVTMTVASWIPVTYTSSFTSKKAYIGNYYYDDGSWGSVASPIDGRTAIGIVFSNTTSTTDQAKGWTHGYAMALTNAAASVSWSSTSNKGVADMSGLYTNNVSLMEGDMDGYSHSKTIQNKEITNNLLSSFSTDYPAFYYALNYGTSIIGGKKYAAPIATNNSGWFLPSIGQWYLIVKNLGGITTVVDFDTGSPGYGGWKSPAALTASTGINSYLNTVSGSTSIDWSLNNGRWFWSSTQWSSQFACNMCINYNEELGLNYFNKDTSTYSSGSISALFLVRPVIAF
jgi:hypothetical protein